MISWQDLLVEIHWSQRPQTHTHWNGFGLHPCLMSNGCLGFQLTRSVVESLDKRMLQNFEVSMGSKPLLHITQGILIIFA